MRRLFSCPAGRFRVYTAGSEIDVDRLGVPACRMFSQCRGDTEITEDGDSVRCLRFYFGSPMLQEPVE